MSFRDRLLNLLHEHEELAKQHETLLHSFQMASSHGKKLAQDDIIEPAQISLHRDWEAESDDHELLCVLHERDGVSEFEDEGEVLPKSGGRSPYISEQAVKSASGEPASCSLIAEASSASTLNMVEKSRFRLITEASSVSSLKKLDTSSTITPREVRRSDLLTSERRIKRLRRIFELSEQCKEEEAQNQAIQDRKKKLGLWARIKQADSHRIEIFIDSCMSFFIVANAFFIGVRMDFDEDAGFGPWQLADTVFTGIFVFELGLKIFIHGFCSHFCGRDKVSNIFDSSLILVDTCQLLLSYFELSRKLEEEGVPSASLFRIIRLVRIMRLIRLFRTEKFNDLLAMLQGMMSGLLTLFWAVCVFGMTVYAVALICRSSFGYLPVESVGPYFENVPRSMYTVFRCSFGDCSSQFGTPLPEHIASHYGWVYATIYCAFAFVITIGLFNVISAIYVDATMTSTAQIALGKISSRLNDEKRWATNLTFIIEELLHSSGDAKDLPMDRLSDVVEKVSSIEFTREAIDEVVKRRNVCKSLLALDIDILDHKRLSDIFDPDHSGTVTVLDLMNGLQRLRGQPRRSDVVTVDLMVRCLQERVDEMHSRIVTVQETSRALHRNFSADKMRTRTLEHGEIERNISQKNISAGVELESAHTPFETAFW